MRNRIAHRRQFDELFFEALFWSFVQKSIDLVVEVSPNVPVEVWGVRKSRFCFNHVTKILETSEMKIKAGRQQDNSNSRRRKFSVCKWWISLMYIFPVNRKALFLNQLQGLSYQVS